jgi:SAM-dependent methyltransferase
LKTNIPSIKKLHNYLKKHGYSQFLKYYTGELVSKLLDFWHEFTFDIRYNVNTSRLILADDLGFRNAEIQKHAKQYRPTPPYRAFASLKSLKKVVKDFSTSTFIDYGCGAGRIMIIAAEMGFGKVIGIDLSPQLIELCRSNLKQYLQINNTSEIIVLEQDASKYIPPNDANVFYFFLPFSLAVYSRVIKNIKTSIKTNPRTVYVLDMWSDFDFQSNNFQLIHKIESIKIYMSKDPP